MPRLNHPDAALAKRTLFELGHELPGRRLTDLALRLLAAARDEPDAAPRDLVDRAIDAIDDGPAVLVAEEPELRLARLDPPAGSVEEGARAVVAALGRRLVEAYRHQ